MTRESLQKRIERMVPKGFMVAIAYDIRADNMFVRLTSPGRKQVCDATVRAGDLKRLRMTLVEPLVSTLQASLRRSRPRMIGSARA